MIASFAFEESSVLRTAIYDPADRILRLTFRTGAAYDYEDVPEDIFRRLITAESAGAFYNLEIKSHFTARPVQPKAPPGTAPSSG